MQAHRTGAVDGASALGTAGLGGANRAKTPGPARASTTVKARMKVGILAPANLQAKASALDVPLPRQWLYIVGKTTIWQGRHASTCQATASKAENSDRNAIETQHGWSIHEEHRLL